MAQPTENLRIAPEDGFLPHFTEAFVSYYDDHWSYIYAVADLLTDNFKQVLVSAGSPFKVTRPSSRPLLS